MSNGANLSLETEIIKIETEIETMIEIEIIETEIDIEILKK